MRSNDAFLTVDSDPGGSVNGSDGVFDRLFFKDTRTTAVSIGGNFRVSPAAGLAPCGRDDTGSAYRCSYLFQPDGNLVQQTGRRVGLAPNGSFIGGNGSNTREERTLGVYPKLDRYSINLLGHYTISDAFEPFFEVKYVRTDSLNFGSPAFFQGGTIDGDRENPRFDNPFLTDANRASINAARTANGLAPLAGATQFSILKNLTDLGGRQEEAKRETYRFVGGVRGTFNDDWNYEVSGNYGEFKEDTKVLGNLNQQRFLLAIDSARNAAGNIVCRSQIDPNAALIYPFSNSDDFAQSLLANDVASCVPLNPFGQGNISAGARDYVVSDTTSVGKITQLDFNCFVSGDTSQFFELPGGPIGFALGAEYRRETAFFQSEDLVANGLTFYNALPLFDPPAFEVKKVFGELRIPILSGVPFFEELTLSGAGRVSDYKGRTGTVFAYNGGIDYSPIRDIRFRAGYARAVRAPNLADNFSAQSQNFAPGFVDPCSSRNIATGSSNRVANCAAAGIPAAYDFVYNSSLSILSGGNPDLTEETSKSLTVGGVFQPSFLPGFSLSVDYYNIEVNDVITSPTAQQIADACYDASDLNNQFCTLFQRAGADGGPQNEVQFQILEGSLQQTLLNYAKLKVRGIDVEASYNRSFENLFDLSTRFVYTHAIQNDEFLDPTDPGRANQLLRELGDPKDGGVSPCHT